MNIPDHATEASARVLYESVTGGHWDNAETALKNEWRRHARVSVTTSAPGIAAQALRDAAEEMGGASLVQDFLRRRANEIDPQ